MTGAPKVYSENADVQCIRAVAAARPGNPDAAFYLFHKQLGCIGSMFVYPGDSADEAVLTDLEVLPGAQGNHYSDLLYESTLKFLVDETRYKTAVMEIEEWNSASVACAERNGFARAASTVKDGKEIMIYTRDVAPLREAAMRARYECRLMSPDDWEQFRALEIAEDSEIDGGLLRENIMKKPAQYWQDWITEENQMMFGLYDNDRLIGKTCISFPPDSAEAVFTGSFILPECRGRGLSALLYEARVNYLLEETDYIHLATNIFVENEISIKSAKRNGFVYSGIQYDGDVAYFTFARSLLPERHARARADAALDKTPDPV